MCPRLSAGTHPASVTLFELSTSILNRKDGANRMSDLLTRIENLSSARRKLLERMSAKKQQQIRTYPLSYAQRRMWFTDQLEPESALYNMPYAIRFSGMLEVEIVRQAIKEIARRHESLRT